MQEINGNLNRVKYIFWEGRARDSFEVSFIGLVEISLVHLKLQISSTETWLDELAT